MYNLFELTFTLSNCFRKTPGNRKVKIVSLSISRQYQLIKSHLQRIEQTTMLNT